MFLLSDARAPKSLEFLIAVSEFKDLVHATRDNEGDEGFNAFTRIVDEYIKSNSPSEVNISGAAKARIVKYVDRGAYTQLSLVRAIVGSVLFSNSTAMRYTSFSVSRLTFTSLRECPILKQKQYLAS